MEKYDDIDSYTRSFGQETQVLLEQMREAIQKAAPEAEECISYAIPTFRQAGNLVHYAGYKNHIGFYPGAAAIQIFGEDLQSFQCSKGTVQFPKDKPLPLELIAKIVKFRVSQNLLKAGLKTKKKVTKA